MWLTKSSVGRKVVMSLTGLFLILFITFHVLMNAVALVSMDAYEAICHFLGANWYALAGTAVIAAGVVLHIVYALWLTIQNRKARGNDKYKVAERPKSVEWASQNMLALGVFVLCFMVLHLVQFWAEMQLPEIQERYLGDYTVEVMGGKEAIFAAFSQVWTLPIYLIGFVALWFHLTHGIWSAFQSVGTGNNVWLPRWKAISWWWATIVCGLFAVEAIVFTIMARGCC